MDDTNSVYKLSDDATYTPLDEKEGVLLHLKTRHYYSVNETGKFILERLEEGTSPEEIAEVLSEHYDVEREEAREHVARLLGELEEEQLIASVRPRPS